MSQVNLITDLRCRLTIFICYIFVPAWMMDVANDLLCFDLCCCVQCFPVVLFVMMASNPWSGMVLFVITVVAILVIGRNCVRSIFVAVTVPLLFIWGIVGHCDFWFLFPLARICWGCLFCGWYIVV